MVWTRDFRRPATLPGVQLDCAVRSSALGEDTHGDGQGPRVHDNGEIRSISSGLPGDYLLNNRFLAYALALYL